jgi:hypothetical protein
LDIDDVDAIASEAGKLSKSKDIQDKILSHGSDSISVKNRNPLTYSSFLKKLSKLSQNYDNYPRLARHEYVTEEKDEEEELDPVEEYDDHDLEKIANSVTEDDMLDTYHPSEFAIVDDESGEHVKDAEDVREDDLKEDVELLNEMLSRAQRIRRAMLFARTKSKRERALKLALHRTSSSKVIRKRARVAAVIAVKKKLFKGRDLSSLSVQERERAEAIVQRMQRSGALTRLAIKIAPKIRKLEKERLSHSIYTRKD